MSTPPPLFPERPGDGPLVVLAGVLSATPGLGGLSWVTLNQAAGLAAAGARVHIVDPVPVDRLDPGVPLGASANAAYFDAVVDAFGLAGHATLLCPETRATRGRSFAELAALCETADVVLDTGGSLRSDEIGAAAPVRAYLDLDPGFTQLWQAQGADMGLEEHSHFVTVGPLLGVPGCPVPTLDRDWIGMVPPVSLVHWPLGPPCEDGAFTTVASWRGYGSVTHDGVFYGQKVHAARPLFPLPSHTDEDLLLALEIHPDEVPDIDGLDRHGWARVDPGAVAGSPADFAAFVSGSKGELGIAKAGYVTGRTGWFSDRSSCYLASGRPVLAADTGFADVLPAGTGLVAFDDLDSAAAGLELIGADYETHCAAARAIAVEHLDATKVMGGLLSRLGMS